MKTTEFYYAVYDEVAESFLPVFPAKNDKDAIRSFMDSLGKNSNYHYQDYALYLMVSLDFEGEKLVEFKNIWRRIGKPILDKKTQQVVFNQSNKGVEN